MEYSLSLSNVRAESGVRGTLSDDSLRRYGNGTCCSWIGESCFGSSVLIPFPEPCPFPTPPVPFPLAFVPAKSPYPSTCECAFLNDGSLSTSESSEVLYVESTASRSECGLRRPMDDGPVRF